MTPLFAWVLGWVFLHDHPALWVGFPMLVVTRCTDWYLVFTSLARGNVALSTAFLPVNLVLQLLLLPFYLLLLAGAVFPLDWRLIWESVILVLLLPLAAANALRYAIVRSGTDPERETRLLPWMESLQVVLRAWPAWPSLPPRAG